MRSRDCLVILLILIALAGFLTWRILETLSSNEIQDGKNNSITFSNKNIINNSETDDKTGIGIEEGPNLKKINNFEGGISLFVDSLILEHCDSYNPMSRNCSEGEYGAYPTINEASKAAVAGDVVAIREGIYSERLIVANSGKERGYISFVSYKNEQVILDGGDIMVPSWQGVVYIANKSYINISGIEVRNVLSENASEKNAGVWVWYGNHIIIENNKFDNTCGPAIQIRHGGSIVIDGNEIENACNGCRGEIVSLEIIDGFSIKNNKIFNGGTGFLGDGGEGIDIKEGSSNGEVFGNIVYNLDKIGIYVDAWDQENKNIEIFSNVIYNSKEGIVLGSEMGGSVVGVKIYNNTIYGNEKYGVNLKGYGEGGREEISVLDNVIYGNGMGDINWL